MRLLKKYIIILMLFLSLVVLTSCKKDKNKITIAEVTHSVFYTPQYVAIEKGFFKEEGLNINLVLTSGADKVMAALLSGSADIGLMGPEATVYVYNEGAEDFAVNFAQLTQRAGDFLIARQKINNFTWDMVKGKQILGGRKGGMPEMTLEYVLKKNGLNVGRDDNTKDVNVRTDVQFAALAGKFESGDGDFVILFEPTATNLELAGKGYVVASNGAESGNIPFTAYSTLKSYMEKNPEILIKFTRALYKAQQWVRTHTAKEIAEVIQPQFPETSLDTLTKVMQRYIDIDAWTVTPYFSEDALNKLMEIMILADELEKKVPFSRLVNNEFANKVISE